jgi:hypothetical protein
MARGPFVVIGDDAAGLIRIIVTGSRWFAETGRRTTGNDSQ